MQCISICFFKTFVFICSLLWHNLRPALGKAGVLDLLCKQDFQDRCWLSVHPIHLFFGVEGAVPSHTLRSC